MPLQSGVGGLFCIEALEARRLLAPIAWEGPALFLGGDDDNAQVASNTSLALGTSGADFTLEAKIYVPSSADAPQEAIVWKDGAYALLVDRSGTTSDTVTFRAYRNAAVFNVLVADMDLSPGWHHIAGVFDNESTALFDQLRIYVDGARVALLDATETTAVDVNHSANPLNIGSRGGAEGYSGWVDEVRLSASARYLGATYTVPALPFVADSATRGLWQFNEPAGATALVDSSWRGNTLTAQNGAATGLSPFSTAPIVQNVVDIVSDPRNLGVNTVDIDWSERLDAGTLDFNDLVLTRNGVAVALDNSVSAAHVAGSTYRFTGLGAFTQAAGTYVLTASGAGVTDQYGTPGGGFASDTWTMDLTPPAIIKSWFHFDTAPQSVRFTFSEPVSPTQLVGALAVMNLDTMSAVPVAAPLYDATSRTASYSLGLLPDGRYRAVLNAGYVRDDANNLLPASFPVEFVVLAGDADGDGGITIADYLRIDRGAARGTRGFSNGDFDYNSVIDGADYFIIDQAYLAQVGVGVARALAKTVLVQKGIEEAADDREDHDLLKSLESVLA